MPLIHRSAIDICVRQCRQGKRAYSEGHILRDTVTSSGHHWNKATYVTSSSVFALQTFRQKALPSLGFPLSANLFLLADTECKHKLGKEGMKCKWRQSTQNVWNLLCWAQWSDCNRRPHTKTHQVHLGLVTSCPYDYSLACSIKTVSWSNSDSTTTTTVALLNRLKTQSSGTKPGNSYLQVLLLAKNEGAMLSGEREHTRQWAMEEQEDNR